MKFPAKSSKDKSYAQFRPPSAASGWETGMFRDDGWDEDAQDHCATKQGNYPQAPAPQLVGKSYKYPTLAAKNAAKVGHPTHGVPGNKWG